MANSESQPTYTGIINSAKNQISQEFFPREQAPIKTTDEVIAAHQPPVGMMGTLMAKMYASEVEMKRLNAEELGADRRPVTLPRLVKVSSDLTLVGDQLIQYASIITGRDLDGRKIDNYEKVTRLLGIGTDSLTGFIPFLESSHINGWVIDWVGDRFKNATPNQLKRELEAAVEENFLGHSEAREAAFNRGLTSVYGRVELTNGREIPSGLGLGIDKVRKFLTVDRTINHIDKAINQGEASLSLKVRKGGLVLERESAVDHFIRGKDNSIPEAYPMVDALRKDVVTLGLFAIAMSALTTLDATGMAINQLGDIGASIRDGSVIVQSGYGLNSLWNGFGQYLGDIGQSTNLFFGELGNLINNLRTVAIASGVTLGASMLGDPYKRIKQTSTVFGPALGKMVNKVGGTLEFLHL